jgi:hypothetical protein
MRSIRVSLLLLLLAPSLAEARHPPGASSPRGNRATGITLTAMGIVNVVLLAIFVPLALTPDNGHDSSIAAAGVGIGGSSACAAVGVGLLSVGIPFWVLGQRDLDRQRGVSLAPTGLRVQF